MKRDDDQAEVLCPLLTVSVSGTIDINLITDHQNTAPPGQMHAHSRSSCWSGAKFCYDQTTSVWRRSLLAKGGSEVVGGGLREIGGPQFIGRHGGEGRMIGYRPWSDEIARPPAVHRWHAFRSALTRDQREATSAPSPA
jgi:hypothetical protein